MKKILILLLIAIIFTSCNLSVKRSPYKINLMTIGLDYKNSSNINSLYGTINDAKEIEKAFRLISERNEVNFSSYNYIQEGDSYAESTINNLYYPKKSNILNAFDNLELASDENTITILYYSGHSNNKGSFLLATTNKDNGESLINNNNIKDSQLLSVNEIYNSMKDIKGKKVIISDSCYSGNFYKNSVYTLNEEILTFENAFNKLFSKGSEAPNTYILSATEANNTAHEPSFNVGNRQHGYFTKALLEGLGWCDGKKGELSNNIIPSLRDEKGIQGILSKGKPPAINNNILSIDSLLKYIKENQEINLISDSYLISHQYPCISSWRSDLALYIY